MFLNKHAYQSYFITVKQRERHYGIGDKKAVTAPLLSYQRSLWAGMKNLG